MSDIKAIYLPQYSPSLSCPPFFYASHAPKKKIKIKINKKKKPLGVFFMESRMIFGNPGHGFFSRKSEKYLGIDWLGRDDEENKHEKYGRKWGEGKKYFREKYNRSKLISTKQKQEKKKKKQSISHLGNSSSF